MDDKTEQVKGREIENVSPTLKPTRKRRCLGHCKRFWWVYLLVVIAIVVLVVCLVIFVGLPKIAQNKINDAKLSIQGVNVLDTQSEAYRLEINATITTDGKIHADIDPFVAQMYLEDAEGQRPFASVDFPKTTAEKLLTVNTSQALTIADMDAFTQFNVWFVSNETLRVTIVGDTKTKPSGIDRKYGVTFEKTLDIKGLNHFNGLEVLEGRVALQKDSQGNNFWGKAKVPNASHFTLDIGNITFANYIGDTQYGNITMDNVLLAPGDNTFDIQGSLNQVGILQLVQSPAYCQTGVIPLKMLGQSVTNNGQSLDYFATALGSGNVTVDVNIGEIIKSSLNVNVSCSSS
ncbi:unnamed protein product [Clonostachys rosea f. rosea IK726]|jgi:competence protein ComGC|uniref:Uncharacterized protein n=2 Tax=Bionectria ochroleuca TaxID=29856 RepID=A0A0B7JQ16_BIOOC|nr:unnamed protein product [Clonostachys rosea f. rosea IK726]